MTIKYSRIFAALDGGDTQDMVARKAVRMAADHGAELMFAHVADIVPVEVEDVDFQALCNVSKERIRNEVAKHVEEAEQNPAIPSVKLEVFCGSIQETLDGMIKSYQPDLVLCGERGLSKLQYVFLGSVSTHLVRNVECDILVVKQR